MFEWEESNFFDSTDFSAEVYQGAKPRKHMAIHGLAGSGTSSLLKNLKIEFPSCEIVSGGDYQRFLADQRGEAVEIVMAKNGADPTKGTDRQCDAFLLRKTLEHQDNLLFMEARISQALMRGHAYPVRLFCDDLATRAMRGLDRMRLKLKRPDLTLDEAKEITERRDREDVERLSRLYPGCIWPPEDFLLEVDTLANDEAATLEMVVAGFCHWCELNELSVPMPTSWAHPALV